MMKSSILSNLESMWTEDPENTFVNCLEDKFVCHSFSDRGDLLQKYSVWVGIVLTVLAYIVIAFSRALAKRKQPADNTTSQEMAQLNEGDNMVLSQRLANF
jgi:hypothetical protein